MGKLHVAEDRLAAIRKIPCGRTNQLLILKLVKNESGEPGTPPGSNAVAAPKLMKWLPLVVTTALVMLMLLFPADVNRSKATSDSDHCRSGLDTPPADYD